MFSKQSTLKPSHKAKSIVHQLSTNEVIFVYYHQKGLQNSAADEDREEAADINLYRQVELHPGSKNVKQPRLSMAHVGQWRGTLLPAGNKARWTRKPELAEIVRSQCYLTRFLMCVCRQRGGGGHCFD